MSKSPLSVPTTSSQHLWSLGHRHRRCIRVPRLPHLAQAGSDLRPIECKNVGVLYTLWRIKIWVILCDGERDTRWRDRRISSQTSSEIGLISSSHSALEQIGNLNNKKYLIGPYMLQKLLFYPKQGWEKRTLQPRKIGHIVHDN